MPHPRSLSQEVKLIRDIEIRALREVVFDNEEELYS
jgi:hypothetical protein